MTETYNVYCDESGHLERDQVDVMVLGAVWCPARRAPIVAEKLREIKVRHGLANDFEVKWTKVSPGGIDFYMEYLKAFFDDSDLHFRAVVIPDKSKLRHDAFAQDHDTWYYKMYYTMLKSILSPPNQYRIYLDIKDTLSEEKVRSLRTVLSNSMHDFSMSFVRRVQQVHSREVELVQMADILIGAVSHANRGLSGSPAKSRLVETMRDRSRYNLLGTTPLGETKVNILMWRATEQLA